MKRRNCLLDSMALTTSLLALPAMVEYLKKFLEQAISAVNQIGGGGSIGHNAIHAARADGDTLGIHF